MVAALEVIDHGSGMSQEVKPGVRTVLSETNQQQRRSGSCRWSMVLSRQSGRKVAIEARRARTTVRLQPPRAAVQARQWWPPEVESRR